MLTDPASFVGLNSIRGNFPVFEGTSIYSLRLDHHFDAHRQLMLRGSASPSTVTGIQVNAQGPAENFGQNAFSRTSQQTYRDAGITAQFLWNIGDNQVNETRFQYARRGLLYTFSPDINGGNVAVNIPGFAFFGREPFSYVRRTEQRYQFTDNFSFQTGRHLVKFGADVNTYLWRPTSPSISEGFITLASFRLDPSDCRSVSTARRFRISTRYRPTV